MQVILKETLDNLGAAGSVVRVKDGYARNYLFPRNLAAPATPGTKREMEHIRRLSEKRRALEIKSAEDLRARLEGLEITLQARAGEKEKLYGSVTTADLAAALAQQGLEIDRRKIALDQPIRVLGRHKIHIKVDPQVSAHLTVTVEPSPDSHKESLAAHPHAEETPAPGTDEESGTEEAKTDEAS